MCAFPLASRSSVVDICSMLSLDLTGRRVDFAQRQSMANVHDRVRDIVAMCGRQGAKAVLGVPGLTLDKWLYHKRNPSAAARRWIVVCWLLLRYPGIKLDRFDITTEGRYLVGCPQTVPNDSNPQ